jgi:hypothetical protein
MVGLSAACFASIGLTLVHHLAAATVLVWHGLAVALVSAAAARVEWRAMGTA